MLLSREYPSGLLYSHVMSEAFVRAQVERTLRDVVDCIEVSSYENKLKRLQLDLDAAETANKELQARLQREASERESTALELREIRTGALGVRNAFVADIGAVLNEARSVVKLKTTIRNLEDRLLGTVAVQNELDAVRQRLRVVEKSYHLTQAPKPSAATQRAMVFVALEDSSLLEIFSYLQTEDVISMAQISKYMFARVDDLFGIGSGLIQPHWREPYDPSKPQVVVSAAAATAAPPSASGSGPIAAASSSAAEPQALTALTLPDAPSAAASASTSTVLLTPAMAEQLSKKLTGAELRVILSMSDRLKKQSESMQSMATQAEDLRARAENAEKVRDFLIEKLKSAELAIKAFMKEVADLKVQQAADKEVIAFLDLNRLEIESINRDLLAKNLAIKTSLEATLKANKSAEQQYSVDIAALRERLEVAEAEHKREKKLLVKEVKSLRATLGHTSAELEEHRTHLHNLRRAFDAFAPPQLQQQQQQVTILSGAGGAVR